MVERNDTLVAVVGHCNAPEGDVLHIPCAFTSRQKIVSGNVYKNVTPAMPRRYKISYPGNSSQCVSHLEQGNSIYTARRMSINPYRFQEDYHLVFGLVSRVWGGIRKLQKKRSQIYRRFIYTLLFSKEIGKKFEIKIR